MHVAAVVLAAGASTRFGASKHHVLLAGEPMYAMAARTAQAAGLDPVVVVVPPGAVVPPELVPVINDDPDAGLSRSVQLGVAAVPPECDAVILLLGDEPTVSGDDLAAVVAAASGDRAVVATRAGDRIGPPVLLTRAAFDLVEGLSGDEGLRSLLRVDPASVTVVERAAPLVDIDTPADLDAVAPPCPGCGIRVPAPPDGPTHEYIESSPGCWALFNELLAREFGDPSYGRVHRHTVDVYAVQHPGRNDRRQRQSVALHLIGLAHWLDHGLEQDRLTTITQRLASEDRDWPWLEPPAAYAMTVVDVHGARSGAEHQALVRRWAQVTWDAWSNDHAQVREWAADALRPAG
jgi:CTP:molybdopterin cytidylyltransferase MocA